MTLVNSLMSTIPLLHRVEGPLHQFTWTNSNLVEQIHVLVRTRLERVMCYFNHINQSCLGWVTITIVYISQLYEYSQHNKSLWIANKCAQPLEVQQNMIKYMLTGKEVFPGITITTMIAFATLWYSVNPADVVYHVILCEWCVIFCYWGCIHKCRLVSFSPSFFWGLCDGTRWNNISAIWNNLTYIGKK